ncbi:MAG: hypothetical protein NZ935_03975, partial [Planctomycetes bacterium]|nr:hypothetical protein [Planctomycetota bacterium]
FAAGEHHLGAAGDFTDDGGDVAAGLVFTLDPPAFLTGLSFEGDDVGVPIMVPVDDDEIPVEDRAGVEAVGADELSDFRLPLQLSIEIIGDDEDGAGGDGTRGADVGCRDRAAIDLEEGRVDQLAVGGWSAGGAAIEPMDGFERSLEDRLSPADGAVVAVETEQNPLSLVLEGADREDPVVPDDRRGVSSSGDGCFPGDVFTRLPVPFDRGVFSPLVPSPRGPRQACQFSAQARWSASGGTSKARNRELRATRFFMVFTLTGGFPLP